jgi:hypothetical protein
MVGLFHIRDSVRPPDFGLAPFLGIVADSHALAERDMP